MEGGSWGPKSVNRRHDRQYTEGDTRGDEYHRRKSKSTQGVSKPPGKEGRGTEYSNSHAPGDSTTGLVRLTVLPEEQTEREPKKDDQW